ncbi:uncharacterized protein K460DRAFT_364933 [Cucurbitaria berberidis CBS 394.84]|uniref:Uncharacterized protein n=1 Tax=Cucurbitaria berberidis CBS 394.84 TaxID=1168544 RepID=A0A9P4GPM3_9PLEO|nr:uncharacterized protein K460DRAFT_364933 [Cucurbitaria berberidis CBS 394.84]KAF1849012.1 hypothetical protein K460DRAFT_364933 [Cucurbitaria berberidis CBS 394.84]
MKVAIIIAGILSAVAMASPPTMSLKRSFVGVEVNGKIEPGPCVECPCDGWTGTCTCIPNGCCCTR